MPEILIARQNLSFLTMLPLYLIVLKYVLYKVINQTV